MKHDYPSSVWRLVPLGHWNWKWKQALSNYSTYDQELLAGMLVLSSPSRILESNPLVWLCDQEPVKSFHKGPPAEKAKPKRCWTYLDHFRLTVHQIVIGYISHRGFNGYCWTCDRYQDQIESHILFLLGKMHFDSRQFRLFSEQSAG